MRPTSGPVRNPGHRQARGPEEKESAVGVVSHTKEASVAVDRALEPRFTREAFLSAPRHRMPEVEMLPQTAYQLVKDEVMLDGNARLNLATFVTTWMDDEAN